MAKLGRPRKKRPYHRRNVEAGALENGAMQEARTMCSDIKRQIADAKPDVRRIVISDLIADLDLIEKMAR